MVPKQLHWPGPFRGVGWTGAGRSHWPVEARVHPPLHLAQYLVQVIGAGIHPLAQNIPLLPSEQAPE